MNLLVMTTDIIGSVSLCFNISLLLLIFFHLPSHIGSFKFNFYAMTIVDTLFALAQLIAAPCFFSDGDAYLIFSSRHWGVIPIVFFMLMHNTSFIAISFNFICRYAIVCNNAATKLLDIKWTRRIFYLLNISEIVLSLTAVVLIFHIPEWAKKGFNQKYSERLEIDFDSDFILGTTLEIFPIHGPFAETLRYGSFLVFILFGLFNMSITFLCGIGMFSFIREHSSSRKLRMVNYRLLIILTTQALMSALFVYTPGLITALFTIIHYDGSHIAAQVISSLMSFATLFTPSIVILLTKEYRTKFLLFLRRSPHAITISVDVIGNNKSISARQEIKK